MSGSAPVAKRMITASIMLAVMMSTIDTTIANVALPNMRGSLSAGADQIAWVLTSYILAQTLMTPIVGWLAARIGQKRMMLYAIAGFAISSAACGLASSLTEMIIFRIVQGMSCAAFMPLAQAILYDTYEKKDHPKAMALFGMGVMFGPLIGPLLGGWLTDFASWRFCFWINVPLGILAYLGVQMSLPEKRTAVAPFDFLGFGALAVLLASIQLILDRGPGELWFESKEIWVYAATATGGLYIFIVQTILGPRAFFDKRLLADRNFVLGSTVTFWMGGVAFSTLALTPMMMQSLMHLTPLQAGMLTAPRGLGVIVGMLINTQLVKRFNPLLVSAAGFALMALSFWDMGLLTIEAPHAAIIYPHVIQGIGIGFIFVNINTYVFSNVPPLLRAEAASINTLARSLGSSFGISLIQYLFVRNSQVAQADLSAAAQPMNQLSGTVGASSIGGPDPMMLLQSEIMRQAAMISYVDAFRICAVATFLTVPFLFFLRASKRQTTDAPHVHFD